MFSKTSGNFFADIYGNIHTHISPRFQKMVVCVNKLLKIKQVLLDSCSSRRMQAELMLKALDQSSQARTDPGASKQYSDSFPVTSLKSQQFMSPTTASAIWNQKRELFS
jgi:hypothetical protein